MDLIAPLQQELTVIAIIFVLLFIRLGAREPRSETILGIVNVLLGVNLAVSLVMSPGQAILFGGAYHTNELLILEKNILNFGTLLISLQAYDWLKGHKQALEFYMLLLTTLAGLFFMVSAGNLLMFYLGLEMSTIPLAALSNFDLDKRQSSEAAVKFIMSSAFSSALLLFGISLLYGATGSLDLGILAPSGGNLSAHLAGIAGSAGGTPLLIFAFVLVLSGFAFKISVAPFHLWTADVYEGSPVPVTAYLSVISKGAVFFIFIQVLYTTFKPMAQDWYPMLALLAVLTMLTGNLFALRQNNLKRLLAFSSIAQVGFILVGISASSRAGNASVIYFILVYIFSNLGAFGVVALISALTGKETIDDYKGLYSTNPFLSWVLAISLFSLAGIPPTAGFFGKFFLLLAGAGKGNYVLIVIAAANMVISLYYYLRVARAIFMEPNERPIPKLRLSMLPQIACWVCLTGILLAGLLGWIYDYIYTLSPNF